MGPFAQRWWRSFPAILLALGTLVGAYFGAAAIDRLWLFWIIIPAAIFFATAYSSWPKFVGIIVKVRAYDQLLRSAATVRQQNSELTAELINLRAQQELDILRAKREGAISARGIVAAFTAQASLTLIGIAIMDGRLVMAAQIEGDSTLPAIGAIYKVLTSTFHIQQGLVEVIEHAVDRRNVLMTCHTQNVPAFWDELARLANVSPIPPGGIELTTATLSDFPFMDDAEKSENG